MKQINITSILNSQEGLLFKENYILSICSIFTTRARSIWKRNIIKFSEDNSISLRNIFIDYIDFQRHPFVNNLIRNDLIEGIPKIYAETLGIGGSPLRNKYFQLFKNSGLSVCTLCNHEKFISSNFEIDHIYPQSKYKLGAINLRNLLPQCHYCNANKGTQKGLCNFYKQNLYTRFKFNINSNPGSVFSIEDIEFTIPASGKMIDIHKEKILKDVYLSKNNGLYNGLKEYVKFFEFKDTFYNDCPEGMIRNSELGLCIDDINECNKINLHPHSKFILDCLDKKNYKFK